jgi:hypothetical protein
MSSRSTATTRTVAASVLPNASALSGTVTGSGRSRGPRPALDIERSEHLLGHRRRTWMRGGSSGPVQIIEGVEWEIPPMTGDNTQRCRCGLELRAPTGRRLLEVLARHNGACVVLQKPHHWSVERMLRQKAHPHRDVPARVPGEPS